MRGSMLSVGSSVLAWRWLITIEPVSGSIRVSIELVTIGLRSGVQSICVLPHRLAILSTTPSYTCITASLASSDDEQLPHVTSLAAASM